MWLDIWYNIPDITNPNLKVIFIYFSCKGLPYVNFLCARREDGTDACAKEYVSQYLGSAMSYIAGEI